MSDATVPEAVKLNADSQYPRITYYSSIKELPAARYTELQKMIAYDVNVGSTFEDAAKHLEKFFGFVGGEKFKEAKTEAVNLHNNYYFLMEGFNFTSMSFACMVKEIDGEPVQITDEDSIKNISDKIGEILSQGEVEEITSETKKNSGESLRAISQNTLTRMIKQISQLN